jgi:hypothetical protein
MNINKAIESTTNACNKLLGKVKHQPDKGQSEAVDTVKTGESEGLPGVYYQPRVDPTSNPVGTRVTPLKKSVAKEGNWSGINKPVLGTNEDGNKVVFKHNTLGIFQRACPPDEMRNRDVKEVVASHIMADEFNLPSVTYDEGYLVKEDGQEYQGIVCGFIEGLNTLEDASLEDIKNLMKLLLKVLSRDGWVTGILSKTIQTSGFHPTELPLPLTMVSAFRKGFLLSKCQMQTKKL